LWIGQQASSAEEGGRGARPTDGQPRSAAEHRSFPGCRRYCHGPAAGALTTERNHSGAGTIPCHDASPDDRQTARRDAPAPPGSCPSCRAERLRGRGGCPGQIPQLIVKTGAVALLDAEEHFRPGGTDCSTPSLTFPTESEIPESLRPSRQERLCSGRDPGPGKSVSRTTDTIHGISHQEAAARRAAVKRLSRPWSIPGRRRGLPPRRSDGGFLRGRGARRGRGCRLGPSQQLGASRRDGPHAKAGVGNP
jgi:hypothetical protein